MSTDSENQTAFISLAKHAFAEQSYAPTDVILMAAAKNLVRLQTPKSACADPTPPLRFEEALKRLAHV
jgi:hypothetical protein